MVSKGLINANPIIYDKKERRVCTSPVVANEYAVEPIDQQEVFDILSAVSLCLFYLYVSVHNLNLNLCEGATNFSSILFVCFYSFLSIITSSKRYQGPRASILLRTAQSDHRRCN